MKSKIITRELKPELYEITNKETGEIITFGNQNKVFATKLTGEVEYSSTDYSYFDNGKCIELFNKGIKYNELGVLIIMSLQISRRYNVCMYDAKTPFTTKTLSEILKITPQATRNIIRRLIELKIIAHVFLNDRKDLGKVYVVDPQLIRKGKLFSGNLKQLFESN